MFYSTTKYNLANGDGGRTVRILKELLYQIPQVRQAVPEVISSSQTDDRFDSTAQTAVSFFQKWQNLKLRDGSVNYETWVALGNFTTEPKVEFLTDFDPVLKIMLAGASLKNNTKNVTLWPSQYGHLTHQNSVRRVLTKPLSTKDLNRLLFAILDADRDEWQAVEYSYRHAMTPTGWSKKEARKKANQFVNDEIRLAQRLIDKKDNHGAMLHLGYAMHCLQDATSPAHAGFKVYEGGHLELASHIYEELFDPGPGSWLDKATELSYKYFQNQLPCPADYFDGLGNDVYKE